MKRKKVVLTNDIISDHVFLYSTWSGELKVEEGKILKITGFENYGTFYSEKTEKMITCHLEPEKIYNAMVWFSKRDDEKAIDLLVKYHEKEIEKLKAKIEGHLNKMILIKGGIKNG